MSLSGTKEHRALADATISMKGLQREEAPKVVALSLADSGGAKPIPAQPKKWRRVTINKKTLACALIAEIIIVGAILAVNWSLAERGDPGFWLAAMAGALAMATCELVRTGLVYLGAVHRRRAVRGFMLFGALLSVLVTTKSMSIVYEQLFTSRLREVVAATMMLDRAQANKATIEAKRKGPAADDVDQKARLVLFDSELAGLRDTLKQFGTPPKPVTKWVPIYNRHGQVIGRRPLTTTPPWPGATMQSQYLKAQAKRDELATELQQNQTGLRVLETQIAQADEAVTAANNQRMAKVAASQMHSYAAMIFLKSPHEVTEKEVHVVLLVFVLLAAFATAVVASLAVYGSFTRFTANDEPRRGDDSPNAVVITPTLLRSMERLLAARASSPPSAQRA